MSLAHIDQPESARPDRAELVPGEKYFNRESSWLAFNHRVFEEAAASHNPLLERVNFLGIAANNLDEFFMKRVGGLQRQLAAGVTRRSMDGKTPLEQLDEIRAIVSREVTALDQLWLEDLLPALKEEGIAVAAWNELTDVQKDWLRDYFEKMIMPILTPLGVGPGQPFPFISNLSLSLAVLVQRRGEPVPRLARVKIPSNRSRFVQIPDQMVFVPLEEITAQFLDRLFVGIEILESSPFRVTRNADIERNEEEADDLLEVIEEELRTRRFAPTVRIETQRSICDELKFWMVQELGVHSERDVYQSDTMLGLRDLFALGGLDVSRLRFESHHPVSHPRLRQVESSEEKVDLFDVMRRNDLLVHHPYQSFATSVMALLEEAAVDPRVVAIKQTLYRTAANSPIVDALLKAVEAGKEVNVQVEIKARFDEASNIEWVRKLEKAGAHVSYGFIGLKTHSKTLLIVRDEPAGIRRYAHIGTGNYHTGTARLYTDLGLFTCDPELCEDVSDLFNYLTGHSDFREYRKLLVAPVNMRERFVEMISRETKNHIEENPGRIIAKMNQLEDPEIIEALYEASRVGVQIDLIIRGFCCLRPGVPGLSENIRIMCVIGRFLEHTRIYFFRNGGKHEYYIGSADWMSRNLDNRVEAITPIESLPLQQVLETLLKEVMADQAQAWDLQADGSYVRRAPREGLGCQQFFIDHCSSDDGR